MMSDRIADRAAREAALDPSQSCIVQAPAGSGKTGLLTQRFLRLLALVDAPEEVLAITFTRKAAGEMRERITEALHMADAGRPDDDHQAAIWQLARAVLQRDRQLDWGLLRHPARLRIQTIDSFNASLTRQMPLLSGLGAPPAISDDARVLYTEAATRTIALLEESDTPGWSDAIEALLLHLDNRMDRAATMLADMLARREQWLQVLLTRGPTARDDAAADDPAHGADTEADAVGDVDLADEATHTRDRARLQQAIAAELRGQIEAVRDLLPRHTRDDIVAMARFAAASLRDAGRDSPIQACLELAAFPDADPSLLAQWQGLAELLLTGKGQWRKQVNINSGFPPGCPDQKQQMQALLEELTRHSLLASRLHRLRTLPPPVYDDAQWRLIEAFTDLLRLAAAQLQLVFAERGEVDHAEIALRAVRALGDEERPTDLALALDHRIHHILVDEFQDTSTSQYQLLAALTRDWTPGDGRSLFVVGDPMQSIYAFREAEVGLFLGARREGLAGLPLKPLRLSVNFRSSATLVDWVNRQFPQILPSVENVASGAVSFEAAVAFRDAGDGAVEVHPLFGENGADSEAEAAVVVSLIRRRLAETEDGTVAVLVRRRKDVATILPALRLAGIGCQAVDIESLETRPVVQDLIALTRALLHQGDRTAWLAVLRAHWCGLGLADLHSIVQTDADPHSLLCDRIFDEAVQQRLSPDGRWRLQRILPALGAGLAQRRRGTVRERVEATWYALGGPAAAGSRAALEDAEAFLTLLEATEQGGDLDDIHAMNDALARLFARPDPDGNPRLQVMTIHKAKGLEFDTVILPGLHAALGRDDKPLMRWMQRPRPDGDNDLLLAPVHADDDDDRDPIYAMIGALEKEKRDHEHGRLLYVAVTRAVRRLDLVGHVRVKRSDANEFEVTSPKSGSLLSRLWPAVEHAFVDAVNAWSSQPEARTGDGAVTPDPLRLRRLSRDWQMPAPAEAVAWQGGVVETDATETEVEFEWAGQMARQVGLVVHRFLQQIADDGLSRWDSERLEACRPSLRAMLIGQGTDPAVLDAAQRRVMTALENVLADQTGRWILHDWTEARNELALTTMETDGPRTSIVDRTFVDDDGTRWIIDYKTGYRAGGDVEGFLVQEAERYRPALARYAALFRLREPGVPVRTALYFPLLGRLHEVSVAQG